jgi:hypothetical protein
MKDTFRRPTPRQDSELPPPRPPRQDSELPPPRPPRQDSEPPPPPEYVELSNSLLQILAKRVAIDMDAWVDSQRPSDQEYVPQSPPPAHVRSEHVQIPVTFGGGENLGTAAQLGRDAHTPIPEDLDSPQLRELLAEFDKAKFFKDMKSQVIQCFVDRGANTLTLEGQSGTDRVIYDTSDPVTLLEAWVCQVQSRQYNGRELSWPHLDRVKAVIESCFKKCVDDATSRNTFKEKLKNWLGEDMFRHAVADKLSNYLADELGAKVDDAVIDDAASLIAGYINSPASATTIHDAHNVSECVAAWYHSQVLPQVLLGPSLKTLKYKAAGPAIKALITHSPMIITHALESATFVAFPPIAALIASPSLPEIYIRIFIITIECINDPGDTTIRRFGITFADRLQDRMEGIFDNFLTGFIVKAVKNMLSPEVLSELLASQAGREAVDGLKKAIRNEDESN